MISYTSPGERRHSASGLFGILNSVPHPIIVEMIATAGYDFVLLDLEHLPHHETLLSQCIQLAQLHGCTPLVRITVDDIPRAGRILDMGAHGIVLSRAESAEQISALRDAMFFPPLGKRGITGGSVTGFGTLPLGDYIRQANEKLWLVPMIETPQGIDSTEAMLRIAQVTMVMEGALDLAMSMQLGPQPSHPDVEAQIRLLAARCRAAGKTFCANPRTPEQQHYWHSQGIDCWLCGEDRGFLFRTLKQRLTDLQSL
ncbi:HpcH/HpaI aldolase family protein [Erwinia mallotivora]|uniref:4-hydroxy-2-oxovalerate aldolase n=1 Tax=Erwinia mallotivora TaxID=69222 RepID=A0A014N3G2_9GAMM|nr:aldolase/citrate lyase family protein [Erwinia mallotivora]EXU73943.1 4-hydroxy-2-oxovalerate aldolase [Erwinia mallotivora]